MKLIQLQQLLHHLPHHQLLLHIHIHLLQAQQLQQLVVIPQKLVISLNHIMNLKHNQKKLKFKEQSSHKIFKNINL